MGVQAQKQQAAVSACAIGRDVESFDLLIEDLEAELGEAWGGLDLTDGLSFIEQHGAGALDFVCLAIDKTDEDDLAPVGAVIRAAKMAAIPAILIADDVSPIALHQLMRLGASDFVPYPLPEGALHEAIGRVRARAAAANAPAPEAAPKPRRDGSREGVVFSVHGLAGGVGSSTFAVNLAWELSELAKAKGKKVCLLDFDIQFGSVATFLDLPRRENVYELLSDTAAMDSEAFRSAAQTFNDQLTVLTAPADALPLDLITADDVTRLIDLTTKMFDFVIVDLPTTMVNWTAVILDRSHIYFSILEMDMRCAQNALRFVRTLKSEELPIEKVRYGLNRAPGFTDLNGKSRVKRLAESLNISIELHLPDGGKPVLQSGDHGLPLALDVPKNALRKEIAKTAANLFAAAIETDAAEV